MTEQVLIDHERELDYYKKRARAGMALLPSFDWHIKINTFGDITLTTTEYEDATEALIGVGLFHTAGSTFFYKDGLLITLGHSRD